MDAANDIAEFLTTRRARITPGQAGLPAYGKRRVPGLRREEVAVLAGVSVPYYTRLERGDMRGVSESVLEALAGVSVPYYTRLERGDMSGVSDSVLDALARALQLDDAERAHLFDLARAAQPTAPRRRRQPRRRVRPPAQQILDAMTGAAAFVRNDRLDILGGNRLGYALYSEMFAGAVRPVNTARFVFLDPRARDFYLDWDRAARDTVAVLRSAAGRDPHDRALSDLVGELSTQSELFRQRWASRDVKYHRSGIKRIRHLVIGNLDPNFESMVESGTR